MARARAHTFVTMTRLACRHFITRANWSIIRHSSTTATSTASPNRSITETLPARWLTDLKRRIGYCTSFGLDVRQIDEAGSIMSAVAKEWRELVAGSEGFLTGKARAGIEGREVEWGEMVSMMHEVEDRSIEMIGRSNLLISCNG